MSGRGSISAVLGKSPTRSIHATLVRCVALIPLAGKGAPEYLFTSGLANRYNPAGVECVYFSEDEKTARAEYSRRLGVGAKQPLGIYFAEIKLAKVLDLEDERTRKLLSLTPGDLKAAWQTARKPTRTQVIGLDISKHSGISAIRFPSDAARAAKFAGFNIVVFRNCIQHPDFVRILGPTRKALEKWP